MRTFLSVEALISTDAAQRQKLLDQYAAFDDDDASISAVHTAGLLTLAASASDVAFDFGSVTAASLVLIIAQQAVTVKFNGTGSPAIPVRPTAAKGTGLVISQLQKTDQPGIVVWRGKVDSIHLGNPSGSAEAEVYIAIVGNAA